MRWLICLIPLFLACSDPLGPGRFEGTIEGKGEAFIASAGEINNIRFTAARAIFVSGISPLSWQVNIQNLSTTVTANLSLDIFVYPDSLRAEGTHIFFKCCQSAVLLPLEQKTVIHTGDTSLDPSLSDYYWTIKWIQLQ